MKKSKVTAIIAPVTTLVVTEPVITEPVIITSEPMTLQSLITEPVTSEPSDDAIQPAAPVAEPTPEPVRVSESFVKTRENAILNYKRQFKTLATDYNRRFELAKAEPGFDAEAFWADDDIAELVITGCYRKPAGFKKNGDVKWEDDGLNKRQTGLVSDTFRAGLRTEKLFSLGLTAFGGSIEALANESYAIKAAFSLVGSLTRAGLLADNLAGKARKAISAVFAPGSVVLAKREVLNLASGETIAFSAIDGLVKQVSGYNSAVSFHERAVKAKLTGSSAPMELVWLAGKLVTKTEVSEVIPPSPESDELKAARLIDDEVLIDHILACEAIERERALKAVA